MVTPPLRLICAGLVGLSLMTGCQTSGKPVDNPRKIWCDHNKPRRDATAETPRTVLDEINNHNALGALWCGWRA